MRRIDLFRLALPIWLGSVIWLAACTGTSRPAPSNTSSNMPTAASINTGITPEPAVLATDLPTSLDHAASTLPSTAIAPPATPTNRPPTATLLPPVATMKIMVNVRAGPGAAFPLMGKLKKGEQRPILGKNEDGKWWQIQFEDKPGWIAADYTDVQGGTNGVPIVPAVPAPTATTTATRETMGSTPTPGATPTTGPTLTPTTTPTLQLPAPSGRIYFVVRQSTGNLNTAWLNPSRKEHIFSDVALGTSTGDFSLNLSTNASPLDFSERTGKLAYVTGFGAQNKLQTEDENSNVMTLDSHGAIVTPRWFADGRRIAFVGYDSNFKTQAIYIMNADGSKPANYVCFAARPGETLRGLAVSKKTDEIVFVSDYSGRSELWKLDRFCHEPTQLTHDNADDTAPAFSPDGSRLAFVSNKTGPTDHRIYVMNADGTNVQRLVPGFTPSFSPDGFWIAFAHNSEVYIMDLNGGNIQTLAPGDHPAWAP